MAAVMHHTIHIPASLSTTLHRFEKLVGAMLLTLLPPLAFAMLILGGLLLATAVSKLL
jgi:hypothetical protein